MRAASAPQSDWRKFGPSPKEMATMPTLLSDHDVEGHVEALLMIWTLPKWIDIWQGLACEVETFKTLGLPTEILDADVWQFCQAHQIVLITGNRNAEGEDSLERASQRL